MTSGQLSNIRFQLTSTCTAAQAAGTTFTVTNDIIENQVITATNASILLSTIDGKTIERMRGTFAAGVFTIAARGLTRAATETADSSLQKERRPGTLGKIVAFAFDNVDVDNTAAQTLAGAYTFTGTCEHNGLESFNKGFTGPVFADAAARDTAIPSPENGMHCYLTDAGMYYDYTAGSWEERTAGSITPNASETVAGKVEQATDTEFTAGTETGGTGAKLFVDPSKIMGASVYGDGSDGAVTISSNTTLYRDMNYTDLTINAGKTLYPNGFRIRCTGTLTNNGTISANGNNGGNGGSKRYMAARGGGGGEAPNAGSLNAGVAGGQGGDGHNTYSGYEYRMYCKSSYPIPTTGVLTYSANNGARGGGTTVGSYGTQPYSCQGPLYNTYFDLPTMLKYFSNMGSPEVVQYKIAASAGGGVADTIGTSTDRYFIGAGGGGSSGNLIWIAAVTFNNAGVITAVGGNGGNAGETDSYLAGGGGGGHGGYLILIRTNLTALGTVTLTGGTGGKGGYDTSTSSYKGQDGENGGNGAVIQFTV